MERALPLLKALALGTVPVVGAFLVLLLFQASGTLAALRKDESGLAISAQTALDTINRSCGTVGRVQPCGTLAEVDKVLTHSSDLIVQSQKAVRDADAVTMAEAAMLPVWNAQFTSTLKNVDATVATAGASVAQLTQGALPVLRDTDAVLKSANTAVAHVDVLAASPEIKAILVNIEAGTLAGADGIQQADAILKDGRVVADKYVAPQKWYIKALGYLLKGGELTYDFIR